MKKRIARRSGVSPLYTLLSVPEKCLGCGDIEVFGGCELTMTGCRRVKEYSSSRIRLGAKKYDLLIEGEDLLLISLAGRAIRVSGSISLLSFEREAAGGLK